MNITVDKSPSNERDYQDPFQEDSSIRQIPWKKFIVRILKLNKLNK